MKQINKIFCIIIILAFISMPISALAKTTMVPASFAKLAQQVKSGVVNIQTVKTVKGGGRVYKHFFGQPFGRNNDLFDEFLAPFFNQPQNRKEQSLGSGFIISKDGYIVTNNHVIKDADQIKVILHDKTQYDAKIIGTDPMTDLALIKIDKKNMAPLKFGNSSKAEVGSWVVAIGSPFGLEQTVTAGIISAKGRILGSGPYDDFIQTDASINPGNSGGPLLNPEGEVIGINTAIIRSGQGIGFAIPSDLATDVIDQLIDHKSVSRGWLGVGIQNVTKELSQYYNIKEKKGVYITKVFKGDPADKAGIKVGDIIFMINDKKIETSKDLTRTIAGSKVDEKINVKLIRDGKKKIVKVKLAKRPDNNQQVNNNLNQDFDIFGFRLKQMNAAIAARLGYPEHIKGLVIIDKKPNSQASRTNVRNGDLLMEINHNKISTLQEYRQYLKSIDKGKTVHLLFRRGNSHVFVIRFEKP